MSLAGTPLADCHINATQGDVMAAKCGSLAVPENRAEPNGRAIDLFVAVMPAKNRSAMSEPVFFIAGGPGGSSVSSWAEAPNVFWGLNEHHDIVLVDQRGTGNSHPLALPPQDPGESASEYAQRALASLGGDPRYYTTAPAMDDLDAVRAALGYGKIDLYGGSYGATAVQYYLRQHGDHVRAAVLDGGTLIDVPIFELMARNSQAALDNVLNRCLADGACAAAYPDLRTEFGTVMSRLGRKPVTTSVTDSSGQPIVVSADVFATTVHELLVGSDSGNIPWLIHQAWAGNLTVVAAELTKYLGSGQTLVMSLEIMCSEAWAKNDPAEVARLGQGSYMLAGRLSAAASFSGACRLAPPGYVLPNDGAPVKTNAPVLLLNGSDDPQDPPANVAAAAQLMPNSLLVVAPGQGHTVGHIGCLPQVVVRFFDTSAASAATVNTCLATMHPPAFRLS